VRKAQTPAHLVEPQEVVAELLGLRGPQFSYVSSRELAFIQDENLRSRATDVDLRNRTPVTPPTATGIVCCLGRAERPLPFALHNMPPTWQKFHLMRL